MSLSGRVGPAIVVVTVAALAGCSSDKHPAAHQPTLPASTPAPVTSTTPTPTPTRRPAPAPVNPLTGGKPSKNSVVIAKIEDTALGRPQLGIDKADLVYIEQVEGGLTRLMAVFDSQLPVVEPVRSTRANDPELAMEFGPVIYVASGGSRSELAPLNRSNLRAVINDRGGPGFQRDGNRPIPNNLRSNLAAVAAKLKGPKARNIGLVWSAPFNPAGSQPGTEVRTVVGNTPVVFRWNPTTHRYLRVIDGVVQRAGDGKVISTPNVIVQFCRSTVYWKDRDVLGNPAQYTHTVGSGKVVVFRNGRRIVGTWSRPSLKSGTVLLLPNHKPIALTPGGAWFVLARTGAPLS